ncbi:hypothetical protein [Helicobacter ailurogastricus]|uniref:hypothetical protein n=1 Tax=Helicobacter ailurogastricus TaxID=1578720 RepID=UPI000CF137F2|nr:hypothetical protein [Helicobacter ailurogastricus]
MPLPWILGGIALAVIGGIAIMSLMEFYSHVEKKKRECNAMGFLVTRNLRSGNYNKVEGVLYNRDNRKVGTVEAKVDKEDAKQIREGMVI